MYISYKALDALFDWHLVFQRFPLFIGAISYISSTHAASFAVLKALVRSSAGYDLYVHVEGMHLILCLVIVGVKMLEYFGKLDKQRRSHRPFFSRPVVLSSLWSTNHVHNATYR